MGSVQGMTSTQKNVHGKAQQKMKKANATTLNMLQKKEISVFDVNYTLILDSSQTNEFYKSSLGYCDEAIHEIGIDTFSSPVGTMQFNRVLRHELTHAFLAESGLADSSEWATNEEMVDWIARMFPRMEKMFKTLKIY